MNALVLYILLSNFISFHSVSSEPKDTITCEVYLSTSYERDGLWLIFCVKGICGIPKVIFRNSISKKEISEDFSIHIDDFDTYLGCEAIFLNRKQYKKLLRYRVNEIILIIEPFHNSQIQVTETVSISEYFFKEEIEKHKSGILEFNFQRYFLGKFIYKKEQVE